MRTMFREELLNPEQMGERTKKVLQILAEEIQRIAPEQEAEKLAKKAMEYAGLTPSKRMEMTWMPCSSSAISRPKHWPA